MVLLGELGGAEALNAPTAKKSRPSGESAPPPEPCQPPGSWKRAFQMISPLLAFSR